MVETLNVPGWKTSVTPETLRDSYTLKYRQTIGAVGDILAKREQVRSSDEANPYQWSYTFPISKLGTLKPVVIQDFVGLLVACSGSLLPYGGTIKWDHDNNTVQLIIQGVD